MKEENPNIKLKANNVRFRPYGMEKKLPILGRLKVKMRNESGKTIKTMAYIVKGQEESLLGKNNGDMLGIIKIKKEGDPPTERTRRLETEKKNKPVKEGIVSGGQTQEEIDEEIEKLVKEFDDRFSGVGKAKIDPILVTMYVF